MDKNIDPVEFGKLINSVEQLEEQVRLLAKEVGEIRTTLTGGKGIATGMIIAAGGVGAGLTKIADHLFK